MTKMINLEKQNLTYPNISIQLNNNHNNSYEPDETQNLESQENYNPSVSNPPQLNQHQKFLNDIKSYVLSFTSSTLEKKDFSYNFFKRNKNNHKVYQALVQITENLDESYNTRLQSMTILKSIFNKKDFDSYLKVKKEVSEYLIDSIDNNQSSLQTDNYLNLMLPSGENTNELSLEEKDQLFSHFNTDKNNLTSKHVKVSLIDSLFYLDQDRINPKLQEKTKKLILEEMQNLPEIQNYSSMVKNHYEKFLKSFENIKYNYDSDAFTSYENTKKFIEEFMNKNKNKLNKENKTENFSENFHLFNFKNNIQLEFENPVPSKLNDEENWRKLITATSLSLQNYNIVNFNLDLFTRYGALSWKKYNENFESFVNLLDKEKNEMKEKCDLINKERKFSQVNSFFIYFYRLMRKRI